jgi:hypothetical protein
MVVLLVSTALLVEVSGVVRRELLSELQRRLEPLGHSVTLGEVRIDWLGPGLTLFDLRVVEGEREHLRIDRVYVAASFDVEGGARLERIDVDHGRLLISEKALADVRALADSGEATPAPSLDTGGLPSVQVRDLQVDFEVQETGILTLGRLDLSMRSESDVAPRVSGRFVLPAKGTTKRATDVFVTGLLHRDGRLELHTITDALDLEAWDLPRMPPFDQIESLSPRGRLSLHTTGSVNLLGDLEPRGDVRVHMERGSLSIPQVATPIDGLVLELEARFSPGPGDDFWTPGAWEGAGRLSAEWDSQELRAGLRVGRSARAGRAFEGWINAPRLDLDTASLLAIRDPDLVPILFDAVAPHGIVDASFGLSLADSVRPGRSPWPEMEFVVRVDEVGELRAAYHGWRDVDLPDERPLSYALPARVADALVVFAHQKRFPRHDLLDVRFFGRHATGPMHGSFQMWSTPVDMPPFAPGFGEFESDLFIVVPRIDIDQELNSHLPGLWEIPELSTLFEDYGLAERGTADVLVRVCSRAELPQEAVRVDVEALGLEAAYAEIPVPVKGVTGQVSVVVDGRGATSVGFLVTGDLESAQRLWLAGRVRSERAGPQAEEQPTRLDVIELEVEGLLAPSSDLEVAALALPPVALAVEEFEPRGRVDLHFTRTTRKGHDPHSWAEIALCGEDFNLRPRLFPMLTEEVRGRVLVDMLEAAPAADGSQPPPLAQPMRTVIQLAPLLAQWGPEIPLGIHAVVPADGPAAGWLGGAGVRPADRALLDRLASALGSDPQEVFANLEDIRIGGAIDFDQRFEFSQDAGELQSSGRFRLRDNLCRQEGGFEVEHISGALELVDGHLRGERLSARLGETPIELHAADLQFRPDRITAEADLFADNVAIDAFLLGQFLDQEMVASLIEEFGLRGTLDLEQGHVSLEFVPGEAPKLVLDGQATISDAFVALGLPLSIRSARLELEQLIVQGEDVRGWGRVRDLYGQAVGRDLAQTDLLLSYHGSLITIDDLEGQFCRGRIAGLRGARSGQVAGPVLSVDLRAPYRFQSGVSLTEIQVGLLLEDVFASEIADQGLLTGHLYLRGELENLLDVRGSGHGRVEKTVLWSVPVVRDLFSQLGFDETAVFDEMRTDFYVEGGRILMEGMHVHSPLLNLEGSGVLGLDGTLSHDLEVRYSLVDKTGPFSSLIYWLQNRLLAISVRGDMSRPKILLRGVFSNPFVSTEAQWRALPAPAFSPLRERF